MYRIFPHDTYNMYNHRLKIIMSVYDVYASYRLNLAIFLEILILFSLCWKSVEIHSALKQARSQSCKSFKTIAIY